MQFDSPFQSIQSYLNQHLFYSYIKFRFDVEAQDKQLSSNRPLQLRQEQWQTLLNNEITIQQHGLQHFICIHQVGKFTLFSTRFNSLQIQNQINCPPSATFDPYSNFKKCHYFEYFLKYHFFFNYLSQDLQLALEKCYLTQSGQNIRYFIFKPPSTTFEKSYFIQPEIQYLFPIWLIVENIVKKIKYQIIESFNEKLRQPSIKNIQIETFINYQFELILNILSAKLYVIVFKIQLAMYFQGEYTNYRIIEGLLVLLFC
ncbi:unnamed protein product [Paramecium sonneborni]|uniref:Uncharacterized protein n=1 Tax=Paramecium sonneborni TaxID=65129 RepID=A0A8S1MVG8_9CILI|nr:unnamed protein product [Paramecium sonneborni]